MPPTEFINWLFDEREISHQKRSETENPKEVNYWFIREQILGEIILKAEDIDGK